MLQLISMHRSACSAAYLKHVFRSSFAGESIGGSRNLFTQQQDAETAADGTGVPAFVFDIDGVLKRGKQVIPEARDAMRMLFDPSTMRQLYPFCVMTNGGGVTEAAKADELSNLLEVPISADQVILAHTPMQELVPKFQDVPVLVSGRHTSLQVARHYGFNRAVSTEQLSSALGGAATPFSAVHAPSEKPCPLNYKGWGTDSNPFRAVLCFTDPDDWARDLQLCSDVILSGGVPGRTPFLQDSPVKVVFSQNDLLWVTEFPAPRFGMGAFAVALEALHTATVGKGFHDKVMYGKPTLKPYTLARDILLSQLKPEQGVQSQLGSIYMVGDNPKSDIHGANAAGSPWVSVLVRTGVFQGGHGDNCPIHPAKIVVNHVADAVRAGLNRKRFSRWHSQR